ncbi:MAG: PadR family transcriptional regulator [Lachnospiraceae bacterium]|nr:PadR family transcriptional regulator [Lachnospiraceae bacterium]
MLKHGILGLLNYGEMSGYEIMEVFRDSLSFFWKAQTSQIYRELQTLKEKGYVEDRLVEQSGRPDKKLFSVTGAGQQELKRWLREDGTGLDLRSTLLMHVFFRGELPAGENIEYFRRLKQECTGLLDEMQAAWKYVDEYEVQLQDASVPVYWRMTVEYGCRYMKMLMDWCDDCIRRLEELNENISD